MGKKKAKAKAIQPWHTRYGALHLYDLATGFIPKRVRNILAAHGRMSDSGRSAGAAASDWQNIVKNLSDIQDAFARIEAALIEGEDIKRWKELPGLDGAVKQVRGIITLLKADREQSPGGSLNFDLPRFVDDQSLGNTSAPKPNPFATGANGEPLRKRIKDEVKVKVKVEDEDEDDIEEGEIVVKHEDEDERGVPLNIESPERELSPESVDLNQFGHSNTGGFGNFYPGPPAHWMPQAPFAQPFFPPNHWHANDYWYTPRPLVYPPAVIPNYNSGFIGFAPAGVVGQAYPQFPHGANHPYAPFHEFPRHFGPPLPTPAGPSPVAYLPAPSIPAPSVARSNRIQSLKPSPGPSPAEAPPSGPLVATKLEHEPASKRKLSEAPGASSGTDRPIKRRCSVQGSNSSGVDGDLHSGANFSRPDSVPPDFGSWFQGQVADRKKKLSRLERAIKPTVERDGV